MASRYRKFISRILLALVALGSMAAGQASDVQQIKIPPLPPFHPKEPARVQLANGMVIFLQEDHELPLINALAYIRGGAAEEAAAKTGMVSLYAQTWRTGGTKTKTGDQLDIELESRAAHVETGGGVDTTTIHFDCLKPDLDTTFATFLDLLRNPEFREDKLELAKKRMASAIVRRNDDSDEIAGREAARLGYGANSPYARIPELYSIATVTRADLVAFHQSHVHPNNIIFGMVGDFDSAEMEKRLRAAFEAWPRGSEHKVQPAPIEPAKPGIYFVEKPDVNQSQIQMVELGIQRDNPDYFAVRVFNELFGGGFSSRLFKALRTREGLAYSVGGGIGASYNHRGLVNFEIGTKSGSTVQAIKGLYRELENLAKEPATEEELDRAKDAILNGFIFNFDSPDKVLAERMTYELYSYPADFLERFRTGVEKVTIADVNRVAQKYISRDKLAVLVVGHSSEFDQPLTSLGAVTALDITIPKTPAGTKAQAAPAAPGAK